MSRKSAGRSGGAQSTGHRSSDAGSDSGKQGQSQGWRVDASLPVATFMRKDVAYLRENMWVDAAVSFLSERGLRDAPVLDDEGRPVGVLYVDDVETEDSDELGDLEWPPAEASGDARPALTVAGQLKRDYGVGPGFHLDGRRRLRVREVMVPYVPEISAEASIASVGLVMHDNQLDHVMVVGDDGRAVGTFSREELVEWLVEQTSGGPATSETAGRRLRDVMRPLISVRRRASLMTARDLLATHDLEELPVVDGGRVVGVVCNADLWTVMSAQRDQPDQREPDGWMQELLVEDIMKAPPLVRGPDEEVQSVLPALESSRLGCVLVEHDGRVIGMVSARELTAGGQGTHPAGPRPHLSY
jgi:CBS domain-containing protein